MLARTPGPDWSPPGPPGPKFDALVAPPAPLVPPPAPLAPDEIGLFEAAPRQVMKIEVCSVVAPVAPWVPMKRRVRFASAEQFFTISFCASRVASSGAKAGST
jgi:hypothetical protein